MKTQNWTVATLAEKTELSKHWIPNEDTKKS